MPHEIERVLQTAAGGVWAIEPQKAEEIIAFLSLRATGMETEWAGAPQAPVYAMDPVAGRKGTIHVLRLHGTIMPRGGMMARMSGGASLEMFQKAFAQAANDSNASAIIIDFDSPGGMVSQVPETAAMVRAARRVGRPIVAVANTLAASAAYWIAAAADEIVVTPSGRVGSIGVYTMHDNLSSALSKSGIDRSVISAGSRKTEALPFSPLGKEARAAIQSDINSTYAMFIADVAAGRGVSADVVRADPEQGQHFGGGRSYRSQEALRLGMVDRIATFDETLRRFAAGDRVTSPQMARRRLAMQA